jgi:hypothetical protein
MGPALIGAVALSRAATSFNASLATSSLPDSIKAAAQGAGAMATNSVPPEVPFSKAASLAVPALDHGYSFGFLVCGIAALVCSAVTVVLLGGKREQEEEIAMIEAEPAAA